MTFFFSEDLCVKLCQDINPQPHIRGLSIFEIAENMEVERKYG